MVSNRMEMQAFPTSSQEFFEILSRRHAILLAGRPELNPGHFKTKNNRAGNTEFVDVNRVQGTLDADSIIIVPSLPLSQRPSI